jgi:hypothetical protein
MVRRVLVALGLLLASAPPARAAVPGAGVDRPVPRDAVGYAVVDSFEALMSMAFPVGASPSVASSPLPPVLSAPEVDKRRPIAITWLRGGARLLHLPVADPAAFARTLTSRPVAGWSRMIPGADYVVLLSDDAPAPAELGRDAVVPEPLLSGALRGFIAVDDLLARAGQSSTGISDDFTAGIRRVDFALRVEGGSTEVEVAVAPQDAGGFLGALARTEMPATPNRFLAAVPPGSQVVASSRTTAAVAAAWERLSAAAMSKVGGKPALSRRFEREARHWSSVMGSDSVTAVSGIGSESIVAIQAGECRDHPKMRRLLRRLARHGGDRHSGIRVVELREGVANLDGVEVDEQHIRVAVPGGGPAASGLMPLFTEPVRYAYPRGAVLSVMGAGGLPALRDAVSRLGSGLVDPALDAAMDRRAMLAVVVDVHETARAVGAPGLPPDMPRHASLNVVPHDGILSVRLTAPSMLLRFLPLLMSTPKPVPADRT